MKKLPAVVLTLALSVTGCGAPVQTTRGWVLVENPRYGTLDAKPDEREYVWVREDRATGLTVAPPGVAQQHLTTAPDPISPEHRLVVPAFSTVRVEAVGGGSVNPADVTQCKQAGTTFVSAPAVDIGGGLQAAGGAGPYALFALPIVIGAMAVEYHIRDSAARQAAEKSALEGFRLCMRGLGYRIDGVTEAEIQAAKAKADADAAQAVPAPDDPNAACPDGLVRSRGGAWCVVE